MIAWLMGTRIGRALAGLVAALALLVGVWGAGNRAGRKGAENERLQDNHERQGKADDAVAQEKQESAGLSDNDIIERMRRRNRDRRGL